MNKLNNNDLPMIKDGLCLSDGEKTDSHDTLDSWTSIEFIVFNSK